MFGRFMYFYFFYCLCYEMNLSTYMSEYQVSEERYPDLNEEKYIRMGESRYKHWRYVS